MTSGVRAEAIERLARFRYEQQNAPWEWAAMPEKIRQRGRRWATPLVDALGDLLQTEKVRVPCTKCGVSLIGLTDATRARKHLATLTAHYSAKKVADLIGVNHQTLHALAAGKRPIIHRRVAALVLATTVEELHAAYAPEIGTATLTRLLEGKPTTIRAKDKPGYARTLAEYGWTTTQVARALAISGTVAKKFMAEPLIAVDEYGVLFGYCHDRYQCHCCGTYLRCRLPHGHDGDHTQL
jgi:hypothetical protein